MSICKFIQDKVESLEDLGTNAGKMFPPEELFHPKLVECEGRYSYRLMCFVFRSAVTVTKSNLSVTIHAQVTSITYVVPSKSNMINE